MGIFSVFWGNAGFISSNRTSGMQEIKFRFFMSYISNGLYRAAWLTVQAQITEPTVRKFGCFFGFRVWSLWFRVWGLGFRFWSFWFKVSGLGFRV